MIVRNKYPGRWFAVDAFPRIVSADDHVVEPPDVWTARLPADLRDRGPRIVRERGRVGLTNGDWEYNPVEDGRWADVWEYEELRLPCTVQGAAVGLSLDDMQMDVMTFEDMRPGCFQPQDRLSDMDQAGIEASLCFPNLFVRFCGQRFQEAKDKELALLCVRAYNDFILEEWTADSGGRLIPLGIVPLWDVALCAEEVERT